MAKQGKRQGMYISAARTYWIIKTFGVGALELPNKDVELMLEAQGVVNFHKNKKNAESAAEAKAMGQHRGR